MIHCEQIPVVVEVEILTVPEAMGEHLKFTAIRIASQDTA